MIHKYKNFFESSDKINCPITSYTVVREKSDKPLPKSIRSLVKLNKNNLKVNQLLKTGTKFRIKATNG